MMAMKCDTDKGHWRAVFQHGKVTDIQESWGSPAHSDFALQKGLEKSNTFLSSFDTFLREPITKLAFPPWHVLAGLTQ